MKRPLPLLLLAVSLAALAASGIPMAFWMSSDQHAFRGAPVEAFCQAHPDLSARAKCVYLADLDVYVWQVRLDVPEPYSLQDWVLFGAYQGSVLYQVFTPRALTQEVRWKAIPAPRVAVAAGLVTLSWDAQAMAAGPWTDWVPLVDGAPRSLPFLEVPVPAGKHTFAWRVTLPGGRTADGAPVTVEVKP